MKRRLSRLAALAVALFFVGVACDSTGTASPPVDTAEAVHWVTDYLRARSEGGLSLRPWYRTLDETLPNVDYVRPNGTVATLSDLTAVGRIVQVDQGRAFVVDGDDAPNGTEAKWDAKDARWFSVHATLAVERVIGSDERPDTVTFALPLDDRRDFDRMAAGLRGLGRVVAVLDRGSPLVAYQPSLFVVLGNHGLLATVGDDGRLALPLLDATEAAAMLAGTPRLADLEARGNAGRRRIPLVPGPGPDVPMRAEGT